MFAVANDLVDVCCCFRCHIAVAVAVDAVAVDVRSGCLGVTAVAGVDSNYQ